MGVEAGYDCLRVILVYLLFLTFNIREAEAVERNDFVLVSITVHVPRLVNMPGGTLTAVNKGNYWEIPYHVNFSRSTVIFKWQLKSNHYNSVYGNALLDRVNTFSTVWAKKGSGSPVSLGGAVREGSQYVIKTLPASQIAQSPGWPCFISLGVRYNNETTVYSDPAWVEARIESQRSSHTQPGQPLGNAASHNENQLSWSSPITSANFPDLTNLGIVTPGQRLRIENRTLAEIVSSVVVVRDDNARCSACHYQNASVSQYYRPNVPQNSQTAISPTAAYNYNDARNGAAAWAGAGGFAERLLQRHAGGSKPNPAVGQKPLFLRKLFEKWKNDGYLP